MPRPAPSSPALPVHAGLSKLAGDYDGFILDLWGVIHDGVAVYPGAVDCLEQLRRREKRIVLLSNAPRRTHVIAVQLTALGIAPTLYDGIVSSGQEAYDHLSKRDDPWYAQLGTRCYHIGPDRDRNMLEGIDLDVVESVEAAEFLLNTGPWGEGESVADYENILERAAAVKVPMICSNPDIEVVRGGTRMICAGALARRYEELGGHVRYHGKPDREVYGHCLDILRVEDRRKILAVGDSLRTDIAGASGVGIDSLFVIGGLHGEEMGLKPGESPDSERVADFCAEAKVKPSGAIAAFTW